MQKADCLKTIQLHFMSLDAERRERMLVFVAATFQNKSL